MRTSKYPKDIAKAVLTELKRRRVKPFSENVLVNLFETMFFASIRTEEAEPILFNLVYLDPKNPDPDPPKSLVQDRWGFVKFSKQINFNIPNIVKLAKASDPRSSSLAIFHDNNNELKIWGLIDQGNRYHDYVNYESEEGPERPGIFQASIEGPGYIVAYIKYKKIAELRVNHLISKTVDIFSKGPIKDALSEGILRHLELVKEHVDKEAFNISDSWDNSLTQYWYATICRMILRIKSYKHGGALLISKNPTKSKLNIKYPILYDRLKNALVQRSIKLIEIANASDQIYELLKEDDIPDGIPTDLYLDETVLNDQLNSIRSEIDGSLWFISLLSRVDGLILMDEHLSVRGFGVEINSQTLPEKVYVASTQIPSESNLKEVDYNHFGTRHRSMMRHCWKYPGSVGFVISQDGDVRAMINYEDKLIIWDNIRLQAYTFIKRKLLKRRKKLL